MIYLDNAYKETEFNDQKYPYISFTCEYCKQAFNEFTLNLSVFLYGVAFLAGKEVSYAGITCPACLKTILLKDKNLARVQKDLTIFYGPNDNYLNSDLRYHSSVFYNFDHIEEIEPYTYPVWTSVLSEITKEYFHSMLASYMEEENPLVQDYLSSYIFDSDIPIGSAVSICWFKPEDIEKLVQIENEHQVRIFPRYVHKMSWYERYDYFCWDYKLYSDYLGGLKDEASRNLNMLREHVKQNNENLDDLFDNNPDIATKEKVEYLEDQANEALAKDVKVASEFLDLLLNFDPDPWDMPGAKRDVYKKLWKSPRPFRGIYFPATAEELNQRKYNQKLSDIEVCEISDKVRAFISKSHVQSWALKHHQNFIDDYLSLARQSDFSYGKVWDLKCRYLQQLHSILEKGLVRDSNYAFYNTGPTWTIIFNGKEIAGLITGGHIYLQFLVRNPNRTFLTIELDSMLLPKETIKIENLLYSYHKDDESTSSENKSKKTKLTKDEEEAIVINLEKMKEFRDNLEEYDKNKDIEGMARLGMVVQMEDGRKEINEKLLKVTVSETNIIIKDLKSQLGNKGQVYESTEMNKKTLSRITKSIARAVNEIKMYDNVAFEHFTNALGSINSKTQCYKMNPNIQWKTK